MKFVEVAGIEKSATETAVKLKPLMHRWPTQVFVTALKLNGEPFNTGDQARLVNEQSLTLEATTDSEIILIDLP